jgi:lipopolysaccharide export system protein LptA
MRTVILPAIFVVCLAGSGAVAQSSAPKHDSTAPFDFSADQGELQDKAGRGILTGHVVIKQAEMTLTADRVVLTYTGKVSAGSPEVSRVDATGSVVVTRPNQVAKSQYGVYDVSKHLIIMLGAVTLNQGANTVNGNRLTLNLDTNKAVVDGSGVSSAVPGAQTKGGRVSGRFLAPKRDNNSK